MASQSSPELKATSPQLADDTLTNETRTVELSVPNPQDGPPEASENADIHKKSHQSSKPHKKRRLKFPPGPLSEEERRYHSRFDIPLVNRRYEFEPLQLPSLEPPIIQEYALNSAPASSYNPKPYDPLRVKRLQRTNEQTWFCTRSDEKQFNPDLSPHYYLDGDFVLNAPPHEVTRFKYITKANDINVSNGPPLIQPEPTWLRSNDSGEDVDDGDITADVKHLYRLNNEVLVDNVGQSVFEQLFSEMGITPSREVHYNPILSQERAREESPTFSRPVPMELATMARRQNRMKDEEETTVGATQYQISAIHAANMTLALAGQQASLPTNTTTLPKPNRHASFSAAPRPRARSVDSLFTPPSHHQVFNTPYQFNRFPHSRTPATSDSKAQRSLRAGD